jgi:3'-phosphoadenosine 5'-phosphosulfate sulfotransferase (PAPS reductase)/FAD synthetase
MRKIWKFNLTTIKREEPGEEGYKNEKCICEAWKIQTLPGIFTTNSFDCIFLGNTSDSDNFLLDEFRLYHDFISLIVTPLDSFTTEDIWGYIRKYNIPYCSLYNKGYQKIGCTSCSTIDDSARKNSHKQDDENIMKEKLKKLGYI